MLERRRDSEIMETGDYVEFGKTSLQFAENTPQDVWMAVVEHLKGAEQSIQWWIGDALAFGERKYSQMYTQMLDETDYSNGQLRDVLWVSSRYELSDRSDNLTWTHHRLVAPMEYDERQGWIELAEEGEEGKPWSVAKLKAKINAKRQRRSLEESKGEAQIPKLYNQPATVLIDSLEERSVDLLITDPPYSTDVENFGGFLDEWVADALDLVKDSGRAFICAGDYGKEIMAYLERLLGHERMTLGNILVWTYRNTMGPAPSHAFKNNWQAIFYLYGPDAPPLNTESLNEKFSVLDIAAPDGRHGNRYHEWQKPDELAERLIRLSTKPGDFVVDPFCGTGTFALEAGRMGREAIGSDIDKGALSTAEELGAEVNYAS